jgi:hypothetical protein
MQKRAFFHDRDSIGPSALVTIREVPVKALTISLVVSAVLCGVMFAPASAMPMSNLAAAASDLGLGQSVRYACNQYRCWSRPNYYAGSGYYGYGYGYGSYYGYGYPAYYGYYALLRLLPGLLTAALFRLLLKGGVIISGWPPHGRWSPAPPGKARSPSPVQWLAACVPR